MDTAELSNQGNMTIFHFANQTIKFRTPDSLERYEEIKLWDKGFITVMAVYRSIGTVEEYIDLNPILKNLYIEPKDFLSPIKSVTIRYE